ncbi:SUKH-3 domain-containing protein [Streptomyces sp. 7-21]|uniref:SUKH-3 domain-containing protein n=1 Tax=Streptomyces sp. 7-21 TaxID=2802283 RepID=UPI00191E6056|nr:SUKH-3 domain-containing protein [Streptomyces sp. 7-21]
MHVTSDSHGQPPGNQPDQELSAVPLLRHRRPGILPTTAAALSLPSREQPLTGTATPRSAGAPSLHPVVAAILDGLGTGQRERHIGRCPEVALLSRWLTESGAVTLDDARRALAGAGIVTRHVREDGDPQHGQHAPHCRSCTVLLARLGVSSASAAAAPGAAAALAEGPATGSPWTTGTVDEALARAGWQPGRRHVALAERWADALSGHDSPLVRPHTLFPAAFEAWAECGELWLEPTGPGLAFAPSPVVIDPLRGLHWARTLADLADALGTQLCPLGEEGGGTALLAIDAEGRVYAIDHTGDWYLGPDVRSGLATLLTGAAPAQLRAA